MRTGIIPLYVLLLTSCLRKPIPIRHFNTGGFILEDTFSMANEYLQSFEDEAFPIYYLGPIKDTFRTGRRYWRRQEERFKEYPEYYVYKYSKSHVSVHVDTSFPVCLAMEYLNEERLTDQYSDSNRYYHASTIIIRNISDTTVSLGITFGVSHMHREMLNSQGQWVKVNDNLCEGWFCGTGQPNIYMLPGELIISKIGHFGGKFPVPCRLALDDARILLRYTPILLRSI